MISGDRQVRSWLLAAAAAVTLAVTIGGITRLTHSGLSITEWRPVSGVLPPLTQSAWSDAYQRYLQIPEAQTVHRGITLAQFQGLYWWEWIHRLVARGVGLLLALPYFWFLARGRLGPQHRARLLLLPILVAAQGALGWYMVRSGLAERTDVSAFRLTAHLGLALLIYAICVWSALDLSRPSGTPPGGASASMTLRRWSLAGAGAAFVTMLSGGFVAGLDGGKVFNTFPLMGGRLVPPGYRIYASWWRDAFENPAAAQFHHRVLALATALALLLLARSALRRGREPGVRNAAGLLALAVVAQVTLGIATLVFAVPVLLGVLHQLGGLAMLTAALVLSHRTRAEPQGR